MHKISEKKVKEIIKDLKKYKKLDNKKHNRQYYYDAKRAVVDSETLSSELVKEFLDAYNDCRKSNKGLIIGAAIVATAGVAGLGYVLYKKYKKKQALLAENNQIMDADFEETEE